MAKVNTVQELRSQGYRVRVSHFRYPAPGIGWNEEPLPQSVLRENGFEFEPRGGRTEIEVTTPDGQTFSGVAKCHPKDNFNKRIAVTKALNRALGIPKHEERSQNRRAARTRSW